MTQWDTANPASVDSPFELADADYHVRARNLEGQIVERFFAEPVQIRIPGFSCADVVTSVARVGENFVARRTRH